MNSSINSQERVIVAGNMHHDELNALLKQEAIAGHRFLKVLNVLGQRFIGTGLPKGVNLELHGTPGEDLGAFMDGINIHVFGNAQNAVGNTMSEGLIAIHGNAGDIIGHSMRGGQIWVQGDVGYRVGIHMKHGLGRGPVVIVGGTAGDFLGEYMAGGAVIVLGMHNDRRLVGNWVGTGMHGGTIYIRGQFPDYRAGQATTIAQCNETDIVELKELLKPCCQEFNWNLEDIFSIQFSKIVPTGVRPYHHFYVSSVGEY